MPGQQNIPLEHSALETQLQQVPPDPDDGDGAGDGADPPLPPPEEPQVHLHWSATSPKRQKLLSLEQAAGVDAPFNLMEVGFASLQLEGGVGVGAGEVGAGGVGAGGVRAGGVGAGVVGAGVVAFLHSN